MLRPVDRLALALDVERLDDARVWVDRLGPHVGLFKVGLELFSAAGPDAIASVGATRCFLDLKLHDIPATMARAAAAVARHGPALLTIHASAGREAIAAVRSAIEGSATRVLAVTVLTSLDAPALAEIGLGGGPAGAVERLGRLAVDAGAHGLVCSPEECGLLRRVLGAEPLLVVPGIRPSGAAHGDQKRVSTPRLAVAAGADILVVGRPIRDAADPVAAARGIVAEIAAA